MQTLSQRTSSAADVFESSTSDESDPLVVPVLSTNVSVADAASSTVKDPAHQALDSDFFKRIAAPLSMWIFLSIGLILFNKLMYTSIFRHPLTLTAVHMVFMSIVTQGLSAAGHLTIPKLDWTFYATKIAPLAALFAVSLAASNIAAQRLTVSFSQMIKALTPMMTLAICVVSGMERFHWTLVFITVVMTLGVGCATLHEVEFDALGFGLQLLALTVESTRLVAIQWVVQKHLPKPSNPLVALSLFAPFCAVLLIPASLFFEAGAASKLLLPWVFPWVFANAFCALFLNFSVVWLVSQESGPLTMTVRGGWGREASESTKRVSA